VLFFLGISLSDLNELRALIKGYNKMQNDVKPANKSLFSNLGKGKMPKFDSIKVTSGNIKPDRVKTGETRHNSKFNFSNPKPIEPQKLSRWLNYSVALYKYAKDFELIHACNEEKERCISRENAVSACYQQCKANNIPVRYQYCNKTGQTIGLLIGYEFGNTAQYAPQWIFTGENDLKHHAENEPVAYSIYSIKFIIDAMFDSNDHEGKLKFKGMLYKILSQNTNMIQFFQFFSYTMSVARYYDAGRYSKAIEVIPRELDDFDNNIKILDAIAQALKVVFNSDMPQIIDAESFDKTEAWIYKRFHDMKRNAKVSKDFHALQKEIASNFSETAKVSRKLNKGELFAKKVKLQETIDGLGDIF
jgi:hypothetical protein